MFATSEVYDMNRIKMNAKIFLTGTRGVGKTLTYTTYPPNVMMTGPMGLGQCHSLEWMQGEE
tara:strand:+ start:347 stop:532 length:186 start_codon:yes stop_codon:yes gene_type:complete